MKPDPVRKSRHPWRIEPGSNATIRFLEEHQTSPYAHYIQAYPLRIPLDVAENLIHLRRTYPEGYEFKPEVVAWMQANLRGHITMKKWMGPRPITKSGERHVFGPPPEDVIEYEVSFFSEHDYVLFKMFWF